MDFPRYIVDETGSTINVSEGSYWAPETPRYTLRNTVRTKQPRNARSPEAQLGFLICYCHLSIDSDKYANMQPLKCALRFRSLLAVDLRQRKMFMVPFVLINYNN